MLTQKLEGRLAVAERRAATVSDYSIDKPSWWPDNGERDWIPLKLKASATRSKPYSGFSSKPRRWPPSNSIRLDSPSGACTENGSMTLRA
jgi:hypothetical protein